MASATYPLPGETSAADSSLHVVPRRHRRVAIIGFGISAKDAPWSDPSWEVWAMNGFWRAAKPDFGVDVPEERYSLWFDMHTVAFTREYGKQAGFGDAQHEWLKQEHPFPVLMLDESAEYPSVKAYPIDGVVQAVGRDYFTSTIAYALTYAMALGDVAEIGLWGIDLCHDTEYTDQRPCAEYWIARAESEGIAVTIPERSALLRQRTRYGYENTDKLSVGMRAMLTQQIAGLEEVLAKNNAEVERLQKQMHTDDGALQACRAMLERLNIYDRGGQV